MLRFALYATIRPTFVSPKLRRPCACDDGSRRPIRPPGVARARPARSSERAVSETEHVERLVPRVDRPAPIAFHEARNTLRISAAPQGPVVGSVLATGGRVRVAMPIFEGEVAPRFCFAPEVLVVDMEAGLEAWRLRLPLPEGGYPDRLRVLHDNGVFLLVCDGFNRACLGEAERAGVHVVWGISGSIESAVRTLVARRLVSCRRHPDCWCRGRTLHPRSTRRRAGH